MTLRGEEVRTMMSMKFDHLLASSFELSSSLESREPHPSNAFCKFKACGLQARLP